MILVYDVKVKRVAKILRICRKYLNWVQNSVLEGEISKPSLEKLKVELGRAIDPHEDSIIIYRLRSTKYSAREIIGYEKAESGIIV